MSRPQHSTFHPATPSICPFFSTGRCKYGDNCKNSHDAANLSPNSNQDKSLRAVSSGQSKVACSFWSRGACVRGDTCSYWHDPRAQTVKQREEQALTSQIVPSHNLVNSPGAGLGPKRVVCEFWRKGACLFGETCSYWHDPSNAVVTSEEGPPRQTQRHTFQSSTQFNVPSIPSKRPCTFWNRGTCTRGNACPYQHDQTSLARTVVPPSTEQRKVPCIFWTRGTCTRGDACEFWHDPNVEAPDSIVKEVAEKYSQIRPKLSSIPLSTNDPLSSGKSNYQSPEKTPCSYWIRGTCTRGDTCRYSHDPEVKNAIRLEEQARLERQDRLDSSKTIQHVVFGSTLVRFGAGVSVERVVTGFETSRVRLSNLPLDVKHDEVCDLVDENCKFWGKQMMHLDSLDMNPSEGCKEATFMVEDDAATVEVIESKLDGINFRGQAIRVDTPSAGGGGFLAGLNNGNSGNWLVVSWRTPSMSFVVRYDSATTAEEKRRSLNGQTIRGRKITVAPNRHREVGRRFYGIRTGIIDRTSLFVSGIPLTVSHGEIKQRFDPVSMERIPTEEYTDGGTADSWVQGYIREMVEGSVSFDETQVNTFHGTRSIRARFQSWEDAKEVHDQMQNSPFKRIGNSKFTLWLSDPYQITIPTHQYQAQKKIWDTLGEDTQLQFLVREDKVVLRVNGKDMKAVGMLKVRVERLAAGEILGGMWHHWFGSADGMKFLQLVYDFTGAYLRPDRKLKVLKAYGESGPISKGREMVEKQLEDLRGMEYTKPLKRQSIRFFLHRGVAVLKEAFGEESVTLDIFDSPCRITVRGGEPAAHLLMKLIADSLQNLTGDFSTSADATCPICFCDVSSPFKLACGHEYCTTCLRHFFTSDATSFPLACVADDSKCQAPIALPMLQKFLTLPEFNELLESAFVSYMDKNPQLYKYCKTPDCRQIYPCRAKTETLRCPACLTTVCTKCHEEGHEGMTCEEREKRANPAEQERLTDQWAREAGAKKCPQCGVWIQKSEGCNHMSCKCGAHICWVCMGTYPPGRIYEHMNQAHGSIYDRRNPLIEGEDVQAQIRALRRFEGQR
ncbi:hypothetical protein D9758_008932 [Tetrapyrgos nigripes]|uniref:RING-type E3 ubiquitin transferase n=1 Tax=Tetrapyrgos nigripes TaxID=182062 RepID=A0A8H5LR92_9AGAR|nr:hypothetical protein D9758_008932 [Tetrapyrgos nigripes]